MLEMLRQIAHKRFRISRALATITVLSVLVGCGTPTFFRSGLITADEAATQLANAVLSGQVLCAIRLDEAAAYEDPATAFDLILYRGGQGKEFIFDFFELENGRGYAQQHVDHCVEMVRTGITLSNDCGLNRYGCYLSPANRLTGQ